jgi:8-oxo-dGTP pyrophosphatase MutT (NUDIX family)
VGVRWLTAGSAELAPSTDPARAARHLGEVLPGHHGGAHVHDLGERLRTTGRALADRRTVPGHLTASAVVVDAARARVLLLHHAKLRRWLQPGGHADGDLELAGVALREASEESGIEGLAVLVPAIEVDVHRVDHGDAAGAHLHLDVQFLVAAPPDAALRPNEESTAISWVAPHEVAGRTGDADLARLVQRALEVALDAPPPPWGWSGAATPDGPDRPGALS